MMISKELKRFLCIFMEKKFVAKIKYVEKYNNYNNLRSFNSSPT